MASATRDIRLASLIMGALGENIPFGGDAVSARVSFGATGAIVRGVSTSTKTRIPQKEGVLTITVYATDKAEPVLRRLSNERETEGAALTLFPGTATSVLPRGAGATTQTVTWDDAHFTAVPDVTFSTGEETGTYVLSLINAQVVSVGT
jgi:hypothetical protein